MRNYQGRGKCLFYCFTSYILTRSECCNLVKYLYSVIYWRLYKFRVGVRVGDKSYNTHEITIVVSYRNC